MSSTFIQPSATRAPRKRALAPGLYQASAPSASKAAAMASLIASSLRI
jgi:hypothetical protein